MSAPSTRLVSIDALRGFDMLLISGGDKFFVALAGITGLAWVDWLSGQFIHAEWNGFTFYDFIFPLFLFVAGISIPFSVGRALEKGTPRALIYRRMASRMAILILLGILYENSPIKVYQPDQIRLVSVLGRIAIAGFVAGALYMHLGGRARILVAAIFLIGYYLLMTFVPVPGYGAGNLTLEGNLAGYIDRQLLPGRLRQEIFDQLGLLTTLPAVCLSILGTTAGDMLRHLETHRERIRNLVIAGLITMALGLLWSLIFPINKHLWTSSFILLTAGMSFFSMALFYWLIDVVDFKSFGFTFQVIGLNSLAIYLAFQFVNFTFTWQMLFFRVYQPLPMEWRPAIEAFGAMILAWLFLYWLYRIKFFVKVY